MSLSVGTPLKVMDLGQAWLVIFPITLTSTVPYAAGGESLAGKFSGFEFKSTTSSPYLLVEDTSGFVFRQDSSGNKLKVMTCGGDLQDPFEELADGNYPATLTTDVITGIGWFRKV